MIKTDKEAAATWFKRACDAFTSGDDAQAEECLWRVLQSDHADHDSWQLLGVIARRHDHPSALTFFRRALDLGDPKQAADFVNVGESLQNLGRSVEATVCHQHALAIDPKQAAALANLAVIHERAGDYAIAERYIDQAVEVSPDYHVPRVNKVQLLLQMGEYERALKQAEHCMEVCPDLPQAHWNYSLCLIQQGRWVEGFKEYEYRWKMPAFANMMPIPAGIPAWDGGDPKGKSILLLAEQGAGDTIQFIRYARALREAGAAVLVLCDPRLVPLMQCVPEVYDAASQVEKLVGMADCFVPMLSLPCIFGTTPETAGAGNRYIDPPKSEKWKDRISALPGRKIGVAYAGNPRHANDRDRSMHVSDLAPLASVPDVSWVKLQFDRNEECPLRWFDYSSDVFTFLDTAQIIDQLDAVVTVCTSVAHLSGALGKPTMLLVSHSSDCRWMLYREDTPWYPSVRIVRKPRGETWAQCVGRVAEQLEKELVLA